MRIAVIKKERCNPKDCGFLCRKVCPQVRAGKETIVMGEDGKPIIHKELCSGCGICPKKCPYDAIYIVHLPEELKEQITHQYGRNGFHLYKFPVPKFNSVIGILGQNGIGKSTALNILSNNFKPNLGNLERQPSDKEIFNFFKGTEALNYFKSLYQGKIKVSYKPQHVDRIPEIFKGKVVELLEKVNEKGELKEVSKKLEINKVLERDIRQLSGGELQRVAIAACILKKANVYFFDEPSSYLDIKQRLKVAKIIRSLVSEENCIFVVEHDLVMLDYMADLVHILYGEPGVYGICSYPYSVREGINSYLLGYLRNENMKFRETQIKFEVKPPAREMERYPLSSWPKIEKSFNGFSLKVDEGQIFYKEIIGCVGPNGIGKTTFAKIIAGELEPDNCKIDIKLKISYKPQYIKPEGNFTVEEVLSKSKEFSSEVFQARIVRPLRIHYLMRKKIKELSGGELQRVAIAKCLSQKADVYLLDEPSAHLDVEQRILVGKAIREMIKASDSSAIIIDHDIFFIDYLSERLLVFSGTPSERGEAKMYEMREGMNAFLKDVGITFRRDEKTRRPRVNKEGSVKDREQKAKGEYYYV